MALIIGSNGKALKDANPEVLADGVNPKRDCQDDPSQME
jgi:hypothetical protein